MSARVVSLHRYPVKGFPAEDVACAHLIPGAGIPGDRVLAVSDGSSPVTANTWQRWSHFFALKKRPDLAAWTVATDADGAITLTPPATQTPEAIRVDPTDEESRNAAARRIGAHLPGADIDRIGIITADRPHERQGMFDDRDGHVSLIFLPTVRALEAQTGASIDPLRFRGNILIDGPAPLTEIDLVGSVVRIGGARILIRSTIERCSATRVDPETADAELNVPRLLAQQFGHIHCGIYGTVLTPGSVQPGDDMVVEAQSSDHLLPAGTGPRSMLVTESTQLEEGRHLLSIRDPYGSLAAEWQPGQHVRIHLPVNGQHLWRTYTAVLVNDSSFSLIIAERGPVSDALAGMQPGDRLTVSGPFGALTAARVLASMPTVDGQESPPALAILTAGVGITQALALLQGLPDGIPVHLTHMDRGTAANRPSIAAAARLADSRDRTFTVWNTSVNGRPTQADLQASVGRASAVVICGGSSFVDVAAAAASAVPPERIHREAFSSPVDDLGDRLAEHAPAIIVRTEGRRLPWQPDDGTLLDALEADGARVPYTCRSGVCGSCVIQVDDPASTAAVIDATADAGPQHVLACSTVPVGTLHVNV